MNLARSRKAWRNLAACVDDLIAPPLRGRLLLGHEREARSGNWCGSYWFDLDGETIWALPGAFGDSKALWQQNAPPSGIHRWEDASITERLIGSYLDTPRDELLLPTPGDHWGFTDILRAADRRIGFLRLSYWALIELETRPARVVLGARYAHRASKTRR